MPDRISAGADKQAPGTRYETTDVVNMFSLSSFKGKEEAILIHSEETAVYIYCLVPEIDSNGNPRIGCSRASGHSACPPDPPIIHLFTKASVHPMAAWLSLITGDGGIKLELGLQMISSLCGSR